MRLALFALCARAAAACPSCAGQQAVVDTRWLLAGMIAAPVVVLVVVGLIVRSYLPDR